MRSKKVSPSRKSGATSNSTQSSNQAGWLRRYWQALAVSLALILVALVWWFSSGTESSMAATLANQANRNFLKTPGSPDGASLLASNNNRDQRLVALSKQVELADQTLCSYRNSTKYPQGSRPIAENPDQVYPNQPVQEKRAMHKENGQTDTHVQIETTQSRIFLASRESVMFTVKAMDEDGNVLPLFVTRAIARGLTFQGAREAPQIPVAFSDDGNNSDAVAGDNMFSGVLTPATTGLAQFNGTIRLELKYNVGDRSGVLFFDVIYSPEVPATWASSVREAVEQGSLNFYLKADVREAGRYVVTGRIDDAKGKPYALVTFNDLLPQGATEVKLTVFGKLMRDQSPTFPLTLRDIDAYLLKENADPDRALMSRIVGPAYVSKMHTAQNFSDEEWQSEERSRYLNEFSKDLEQAKNALLELNPTMSKTSPPKSDCSKTLETKALEAKS